jgi:hypothetical protein
MSNRDLSEGGRTTSHPTRRQKSDSLGTSDQRCIASRLGRRAGSSIVTPDLRRLPILVLGDYRLRP